MFHRLLVGAAALVAAVPASAAWHKASSPHFIIYADENPKVLRAFAEKLERFDAAVRQVRGMSDPPVGDGNRLTVFVVPNVSHVQDLQRGFAKGTAGFYMPRSSGSVAFVPRSAGTKADIDPEVVFQHEYAHHLMFSDLKAAYPAWLVEGFAEFYSTANVEGDGTVGLGEAPVHRKASLKLRGANLPIESLLSGKVAPGLERALLYSRGWLLTHYLTFAPTRRGQLEAYLVEVAKGRDALDAGRTAFGDLGQLQRDLDDYLRDEKFPYLTLPAAKAKGETVTIDPLGPGAQAAMPLFMRLQARTEGNRDKQAEEARQLAAAHPDDPLVAMVLAESEWVARNYRAAEAAADKAIALMPQSSEALIWKARALLSRAKAKEPGATYAEARHWFSKANALDPENPEPLQYFYIAYQMEGVKPTKNAIDALHYAALLAPQDMGLRLQSAREFLGAGKVAEARHMLVPVAFNPHGGRVADTARGMIGLIDSGKAMAAQALSGQPASAN